MLKPIGVSVAPTPPLPINPQSVHMSREAICLDHVHVCAAEAQRRLRVFHVSHADISLITMINNSSSSSVLKTPTCISSNMTRTSLI